MERGKLKLESYDRGHILTEYFIGTGGWAYFKTPGLDPLATYSKAFNFVEVNSTFYEFPPLKRVRQWRRTVPPDFHFAVRAHRTLTHTGKVLPSKENTGRIKKTEEICQILGADVLHFQTSPSQKMKETFLKNLDDRLSSMNLRKTKIALEIRGTTPDMLSPNLFKRMQEHGIIHCVDLSKGEKPASKSSILYSRLFGKGRKNIYQPTDEELLRIDGKASEGSFERVFLSFHFVRMYKDAARLKIYKQIGKFPKITRSTGITSLEEVLREDTDFPTTKRDLIHRQGWKLFDLTEDERPPLERLLRRLPDRIYRSVSDVSTTLKALKG